MSEHAKLVDMGKRWLRRNGCALVLTEIANAHTPEIPDVIGFRYSDSILLEIKTSRVDFFADKKKVFRQFPSEGMGNYRYYLVPKGLVAQDELPNMWVLLECSKGRIYSKIKPHLISEGHGFRFKANRNAERGLLYSIARRLVSRFGDLDKILHSDYPTQGGHQ